MDEIKYIIRTPKEDNFTRVDNILVNDKNLSLKAKGIMLYILSKPDDWKVYIKEITKNILAFLCNMNYTSLIIVPVSTKYIFLGEISRG